MNNKSLRKQQEEQHALTGQGQESQAQVGREFATVEDMLRHDALHTPVPPTIEHRLAESVGQLPAPPRPWWRKFLGQ
jgi:hypothetical protein